MAELLDTLNNLLICLSVALLVVVVVLFSCCIFTYIFEWGYSRAPLIVVNVGMGLLMTLLTAIAVVSIYIKMIQ